MVVQVKKPPKRIETIFLLGLFVGLVSVGVYGYNANKPNTQATTRIQTTTMAIDSPEFLLYYNQFWQKFNSTAAVSADFNHDSIVSQTEIDLFKNKFLSDMNLKIDPTNNIFVINEFNTVVSPDRLTCYSKHYHIKSGAEQKAEVLQSCLTPNAN